jgi:hypothetical protein
MKIIFTDIHNPDGVLTKPRPASEYIPEWYKKAKGYANVQNKKAPSLDGTPTATVKRCMPVYDMMTAGYIMETPYDIYIRQTDEGPYFQWGNTDAIVFQSMEQFQNQQQQQMQQNPQQLAAAIQQNMGGVSQLVNKYPSQGGQENG